MKTGPTPDDDDDNVDEDDGGVDVVMMMLWKRKRTESKMLGVNLPFRLVSISPCAHCAASYSLVSNQQEETKQRKSNESPLKASR